MRWLSEFMNYLERGDLLHIAAAKAGTTAHAVKRECERNIHLQDFIDHQAAMRADTVEKTMYERAVNGIEKGVYYKGEKVDTERHYSDTLLVKLAEAYRPEKFTPRQNIQQISAIEVVVRDFGAVKDPEPESQVSSETLEADYKLLLSDQIVEPPHLPDDFV